MNTLQQEQTIKDKPECSCIMSGYAQTTNCCPIHNIYKVSENIGYESQKRIKTFYMTREADESGVSGVGKVLDGVVFPDGQTVIRWCVSDKPNSTAIYPTFIDFKLIHVDSHPTNGTRFYWSNELATARAEVAQQCYLECLAVECGEGECARAIRTKFNLKGCQ